MQRNDKWLPSNYKSRPKDLDFALALGDVTVYAESTGFVGQTGNYFGKIIHSIEMIKGDLSHTLTYYSQKGLKYISEKTKNDF